MYFCSYQNPPPIPIKIDKRSSSSKDGVPEDIRPDVAMTENPKEQPVPSASIENVQELMKHEAPLSRNSFGEINMEVSVTADDLLRAGGFGATDNITRILPAAGDFTDFEDHVCNIQRYEDSEDNITGVQSDTPKDVLEVGEVGIDGTADVKEHVSPASNDAYDAVSMEASVTPDEMIRAGGFGATDDISNFLPVASDFTDFEANLRCARDYEDLNEEIKRPGLGWTSETK